MTAASAAVCKSSLNGDKDELLKKFKMGNDIIFSDEYCHGDTYVVIS